MSEWNVHLELVDGRSKKFWRARVDDTDIHLNYGRIGTDGQTKVKTFKTAAAAREALDKVAGQKRKKGYVTAGGAATAATAPAAASGPTVVRMTTTRGGRAVQLSLTTDGALLRTVVEETHADAADAGATAQRIIDALAREGYRRA